MANRKRSSSSRESGRDLRNYEVFDSLYQEHAQAIAREVAHQYRLHIIDAGAIVAEAGARTWNALQRGKGPRDEEKFRGYLSAACGRVYIDTTRRHRLENASYEELFEATGKGPVVPDDSWSIELDILIEGIQQLPEDLREILLLSIRLSDRHPDTEIARMCGLTYMAFRLRLFRARSMLLDYLKTKHGYGKDYTYPHLYIRESG